MRKHPAILVPTLCMALAALSANAQVPRDFSADVTRPAVWQTSAWRGESLTITARLLDGRRQPFRVPGGASASILWSTNGVDWFQPRPASVTMNGIVTATWTPDMDCGAASYRVFLGVSENGTNLNYGANMLLRMLGSPGAAPSAAPFPVEFEAEAWAWATPTDVSNIVTRAYVESLGISGGGGLAEETDPTVPEWAKSETPPVMEESDPVYSADAPALASKAWVVATIGGTNTWMLIAGDLLGVYREADGETNTLWESSAISGEMADVALRATNNTARITALESRPDLTSWGDYAPDGSPNPSADEMVYLNRALTMMGSGFSWATSGAYAVLCQSGAVAFQMETNGEIRIGLDVSTNYFGIVQGGAVTVGCRTDGISVSGSGVDTVVSLTYAYVSGDFPTVWGRPSLQSGEWVELNPVWTTGGDGTAVAAVPGYPYRFFMATSSRNMSPRFESNLPARFPAGVYGGLLSEPVRYDSVITVTSGGHTYRVPAELVQ